LFFSEALLPEEERRRIIEEASSFERIFFVAGVDPEEYKKDPGLVQRGTFQGGMLPG